MRKLLQVVAMVLVIAGMSVVYAPLTRQTALAAIPAGCPGGPAGPPAPGTVCPGGQDVHGNPTSTVLDPSNSSDKCGNVSVSFNVGCSGTGNPIYDYLRSIIKFMSGIFGIVAVLMVIASGFQYMTSAGNPEAVKNAKKRLGNVILSIILFAMMFGILSYIIPGGVL